MVEKEIEISGKKFVIKELKYKELTSFIELEKSEAAKKMIFLSTGISEEEYNNLSIKEGIEIQNAINEINGLNDFQNPLKK